MNKKKLWTGLSALLSSVLTVAVAATCCAFSYASVINSRFGIQTTVVTTPEGEEDLVYYESEFGEMNAENQTKLIAATKEQGINEMKEGAVLLKNEGNALPLAESERRITVFGHACVDPVYRCSASGNTPEEPNMSTFKGALEAQGFQLNPTLWSAYESSTVERVCSEAEMNIGEDPISFYTAEIRNSWKNDYNDVAILFLARESAEGVDFQMQDSEGISQLALHQNEKDMIELVTSSGAFKKVIVILNTPAPMELDWLETYGVDACLWMGTPGQWGCDGVASILVGETNPSGRLLDTYAANSLSAPACVNSGTNTPKYANAAEIAAKNTAKQYTVEYVTVQAEGIYVGYKYYETRYADSVLNRGNAASGVGASFGNSSWNYADEVTYPFGYGLSYTQFEQQLDSVTDQGDGTLQVQVTVKNTGSVAGKSVVQVYAQTPYGDYERENLVEKSAIQLVAFDKTPLLQPDETVTLEIEVDKYLLAAYDYVGAKGYILSEGDYYLAIGADAHDALNNVLAYAEPNVSGLVDTFGASVSGDPAKVYGWKEAFDAETYRRSEETGYEITNQFEEADLNHFIEGGVTYLSRQDWSGTYPVTATVPTATEEMITLLLGDTYRKPADSVAARDITQGDKSELIKFIEMRGVAWNDEKWEEYLNQFTIEEMAAQISDSYGTAALPSVAKPETSLGDGIDGIGGRLPFGDRPNTCCYTGNVVFFSWNPDLITRRGELMGEEALYSGHMMASSVGANLHRTPFGGRNFEYISEDANFAYFATYYQVTGMMSKGVNAAPKHLTANDQEFMRRGVSTFLNEQALRETALRPFEGGVRRAKAHALMQSYNRLGCTWTSACYALATEVIRNEWGFQGLEITDAASVVDYEGHFEASLYAGADLYCIDSKKASGPAIVEAISVNDDGTLLLALRRAVKGIHFAAVNSCAINGLSVNTQVTQITPVWQYLVLAGVGVLAAATLASLIMMVLSIHRPQGKKEV